MNEPQLLMLHGALATQRQFDSLIFAALNNGDRQFFLIPSHSIKKTNKTLLAQSLMNFFGEKK